jgi:hypothetical protein
MGKSPTKRAVVIGVNKYNDVNIPALDHAENDAQEIFDMLSIEFPLDKRKLFLGQAANYDAIKKEVESIFEAKDPDPYEVVILYFSGHLYAKSEENSSWLCPYDMDFKEPSRKGLRLGSELGEHFARKAHVQKIILILDCCIIGDNSSGSLAYNWDNFKKDFDDRTNGKVTLIIHNAKTKDEKEPSFSKHIRNNRPHHHGVLSLYLIEELDKHNDLLDPRLYRMLEGKMKDKGMNLRCYNAYSVPSGNLPNHIERDQSTIKDLLGYEPYAKSICKFITSEETKAPLCISIQAPWGGGKTSIMRMVRNDLDPYHPETISSNLHVKDKNSEKAAMKDLIKDLKKPEEINLSDIKGMEENHTRLTIWFNPWKYESTEQVWAGLADSIISGVAARLEKKGDLFLFRLHLSRLDPTIVRRTLYDRILKLWLHKSYPWLSISALGIVFSILISALGPTISALIGDPAIKSQAPWLGIIGGIILAVSGSVKSAFELRNVRDEPAQTTVEEYVNVPDYRAKLGFIHHVEKDLTHVFDIIGKDKKSKPLVVFVDDLDRCTPENVASVMEGVNLFLASEIPCIFVMGVDPAIVAASLEQRHKEIIASMPSYSKNIPIGWRFMDKFVQLPVLIPPAKKTFVDNYVEKLLLVENTKPSELDQTKNPSDSTSAIKPVDPQYQTESYDMSKTSYAVLFYIRKCFLLKHNFIGTGIRKIETSNTRDTKSTVDDTETGQSNGIQNNDTEKDKEFRDAIMKAIPEFSENPRDIKRFINLLRFHSYLNETMAKQDSSIEYREASSQQLRDWIVLYLKWPEVIRWLYWNADVNTTRERLECLEDIVKTNSRDLARCAKVAEMKLNLNSKENSWISDAKLWEFLSKRKEHMRISNAMGRTVF